MSRIRNILSSYPIVIDPKFYNIFFGVYKKFFKIFAP